MSPASIEMGNGASVSSPRTIPIMADPGHHETQEGSGIAVGHSQRSVASVTVDIDPDAVANALHNRDLNQLDRIDFHIGEHSLVAGRQYAVILANIHFEVLHKIPQSFYRLLEAGGLLLLSGILNKDVERLIPAFTQAGFTREQTRSMKEWTAIILRK